MTYQILYSAVKKIQQKTETNLLLILRQAIIRITPTIGATRLDLTVQVPSAGRQARWLGGLAARVGGTGRVIYLALPRHGSERDTATPRSVARQELPRQRSPKPVVATSDLCCATMHCAAQAFSRARTIDAAKSVRFFKKKIKIVPPVPLACMRAVLHPLVAGHRGAARGGR